MNSMNNHPFFIGPRSVNNGTHEFRHNIPLERVADNPTTQTKISNSVNAMKHEIEVQIIKSFYGISFDTHDLREGPFTYRGYSITIRPGGNAPFQHVDNLNLGRIFTMLRHEITDVDMKPTLEWNALTEHRYLNRRLNRFAQAFKEHMESFLYDNYRTVSEPAQLQISYIPYTLSAPGPHHKRSLAPATITVTSDNTSSVRR